MHKVDLSSLHVWTHTHTHTHTLKECTYTFRKYTRERAAEFHLIDTSISPAKNYNMNIVGLLV